MRLKFCFSIFGLMLILLVFPVVANAWGLKGHTIIGVVSTAHFPNDLPAFLRTQAAKDAITYLQSEEDRLKIGEDEEVAWGHEWPTYHYIDIADDGKIGGAIAIDALPATRDDFEQALLHATVPVDAYKVGFLPYAILEGYEQVRSDFALWRAATNPSDRKYREALTIHDIGIFSHFVGDGSQPLHVTVHFNGWGNYPNPHNFSTDRNTHAQFEDEWVDRYMSPQVVSPLMQAASVFSATPLAEIEHYLQESNSFVVPFYELKARGGFDLANAP